MIRMQDQALPPAGAKISPVCPVFGECGGCQYQDIPYEDELLLKEEKIKTLLKAALFLPDEVFEPMIPSPKQYHYRSRLDMTMRQTRQFGVLMGFSSMGHSHVVETGSCAIAMENVSMFLPELKRQAEAKLTPKHRNANLTIKTGDQGQVFWGGIGRGSLRMNETDYLWTEVSGKRIFYSLDTFFQANLSILPLVVEKIKGLRLMDRSTIFYDLYGGVGLFSLCFVDDAARVVLVEESVHSVKLAKFNCAHHHLTTMTIHEGRVGNVLPLLPPFAQDQRHVAMIDPPRQGMDPKEAQLLAGMKGFDALMYLSCKPEALVRDLKIFSDGGWRVEKVIPFDFFPRTQHQETLVVLKPLDPRR